MKTTLAAPGLLIAMPQLLDPNFHRSVILMLEHGDEGALGLVINHETEHRCRDVAESFGLDWTPGDEIFLRRGGPVEKQSLWMVHADRWRFDETLMVGAGMAVSRSKKALEEMFLADESKLRLIIGYAGWGAGQLESELAEGSWIYTDISPEMIFEWSADSMWERALRTAGIDPAHLVSGGGIVQ
ncbi:MAG: YqgE/AlgH family protein [Bradymonadia bacterium]